jgi:hypothetical protein
MHLSVQKISVGLGYIPDARVLKESGGKAKGKMGLEGMEGREWEGKKDEGKGKEGKMEWERREDNEGWCPLN